MQYDVKKYLAGERQALGEVREKYDLGLVELRILAVICRLNEGGSCASRTNIAEKMGVNHWGSINKALARFEKYRYVAKEADFRYHTEKRTTLPSVYTITGRGLDVLKLFSDMIQYYG